MCAGAHHCATVSTFFHPDCTVGSGFSPDLPPKRLAGSACRTLHRRSGITPCPEGLRSQAEQALPAMKISRDHPPSPAIVHACVQKCQEGVRKTQIERTAYGQCPYATMKANWACTNATGWKDSELCPRNA